MFLVVIVCCSCLFVDIYSSLLLLLLSVIVDVFYFLLCFVFVLSSTKLILVAEELVHQPLVAQHVECSEVCFKGAVKSVEKKFSRGV